MASHGGPTIFHIRIIIGYLIILFGTVTSTVSAEAQGYVPVDKKDSISISPEKCKTPKGIKKWSLAAVSVTSYASFTYLCYRHFDENIQRFSQRNHSRASSVIANGLTYVGLGRFQSITLAGTAITAFAIHNDKLKQTAIIWAASLLVNSVATDELKKTFQRHRPNTGDPNDVFDWRGGPGINESFPSAHTSNAFTTATVFATMFKNKGWVAPIAYTLATAVGLSRIYKNQHWASDVLAGAAIGFLSAKSMSALYKIVDHRICFLPEVGYRSYSASVIYRF